MIYEIWVTDPSVGSRNWGYYFDVTKSIEVIKNNITDIFELGYYRYAFVNSRLEGVMQAGKIIQWYEMLHDGTGRFTEAKEISCPEEYKNIFF